VPTASFEWCALRRDSVELRMKNEERIAREIGNKSLLVRELGGEDEAEEIGDCLDGET